MSVLCCLQVREYVRSTGHMKGDKWRKFDYMPDGRQFPSLRKAVVAGFKPLNFVESIERSEDVD